MKIEKNTKSTRRTETTLRTERYGIESTEKRGVLLVQGEEKRKLVHNNVYSYLSQYTQPYISARYIEKLFSCKIIYTIDLHNTSPLRIQWNEVQ